MLNKVIDFLKEDRVYFASEKEEISEQNEYTLVYSCLLYAIVLTFYTLIAVILKRSEILRNLYYIFDGIHAALCVCVFLYIRKHRKSFRIIQLLCAAEEVSILSFFVLEAVFSDVNTHSMYIPIAILLILLLFIHTILYTVVITGLYLGTYSLLSVLYKSPPAYINDLYIAIATFFASCIGYVLIANMRHKASVEIHQYKKLSQTDALTGLLNKSAMDTIGEQIVGEADHPCALVLLDLDNFKDVNDLYGHDVGDEVIGAVGQVLKAGFRKIDYMGRFGGDEFVIIMDNCGELRTAVNRVELIIDHIRNMRFSQPEIRVQCSAGISMKNIGGDSYRCLFKRADNALYYVKNSGKGTYGIGYIDTEAVGNLMK